MLKNERRDAARVESARKEGRRTESETRSDFDSHLPEDVVNSVAQETFSVVRRQQLGPQYCHEFLKVHLAVPWGPTFTHKHRN